MVQLVASVGRALGFAALVWGLSAAPAGCADVGDAPAELDCRDRGPIDIKLAHGTPPFVSLDDDDTLPIAFGLQGGFHVLLCVSTSGLAPGSPTLTQGITNGDLPTVLWTLSHADGALSSETPRRAVAAAVDDTAAAPWTRFESQLVVLRYFVDPPASFDSAARETELERDTFVLTAEVEDACGRRATASQQVRVSFPTR